jgi:hypothetical protein
MPNLVTFILNETVVGGAAGTALPDVLDAALDQLAERLVRSREAGYLSPRTAQDPSCAKDGLAI